jgi:hypothetical protein
MAKVRITCPVCGGSHLLSVTVDQATGKEPLNLLCPDLDRRYRLMNFYVNTVRNIISIPQLKAQADEHIEQLKSVLGDHNFSVKLDRWRKIEYPPLGLIDEYPEKVEQIINTYCAGYFYPAVTSSCCLAERILNRLILRTRHHFKSHCHYKQVYRNQSFDNWDKMLNIISDWQLISKTAVSAMQELKPIRHQSIHYNETYDFESAAPVVINKLILAITEIFGVINRTDLYLMGVPGEFWVRSEAQTLPFVREFIIPHCYHAHAVHDFDFDNKRVIEKLGRIGRLTDDEFVELRKTYRG